MLFTLRLLPFIFDVLAIFLYNFLTRVRSCRFKEAWCESMN